MNSDELFVYSRSKNSRLKLVLEDKYMYINEPQNGSVANTGSGFGCFHPASCSNPGYGKFANFQSIFYFNIIWAEVMKPQLSYDRTAILTIDYCIVKNRKAHKERLEFSVDNNDYESSTIWVNQLLDRAYKSTVRCKRLLILINPFGGQGEAKNRYRKLALPILAAARCKIDEVETKYHGHAAELIAGMEDLPGKYDAIVCCSGDGIPHEVFNGMAKRADAPEVFKIPVCQLPCGSGNALCVNLIGSNDLQYAALCTTKGNPMAIDLCALTQDGKTHITFLSQAVGMIADCDLGTENLRWMGEIRFTVGVIQRLLSRTKYPCKISAKIAHESRAQVKKVYSEHKNKSLSQEGSLLRDSHLLIQNPIYGKMNDSVPDDWITLEKPDMAIFYVGKMPFVSSDAFFFPAALPQDGYMDMIVIDSNIPFTESFSILTSIEEGKHFESKHVNYYKVLAYRVEPQAKSGYISVDGESFAFRPFQVEILPKIATVLSHSGKYEVPTLE
ncbi:ATP-NAD kinase-like domain-containing protein [Dipodascopsis uninucleata]